MTTLYPDAEWRPLDDTQPSKMARHDLIILHTMAGFDLDRCDAYFRQGGYGGLESHFGVGFDGTAYQWVDLESRADANLDANSHAISVETADTGEGFPSWSGSNVPAWTDKQLARLAEIVAWVANRYDIPLVLVPDSKPGRRGVGYHRQGIDPWRVDGGETWSVSKGKVCPGDRRVAQIPEVIKRAQAILAGDGGDWFDMATQADLENTVRKVLNEGTGPGQRDWAGTSRATLATVQATYNAANAQGTSIIKLADHDAQWLASPYDGTRTWIESQQALEDLGLKGRKYVEVSPTDERWKLTNLSGRVPDGWPQPPG